MKRIKVVIREPSINKVIGSELDLLLNDEANLASAYKESGWLSNVRGSPKKELAREIAIILIPTGRCISEWEEAINYENFRKQRED